MKTIEQSRYSKKTKSWVTAVPSIDNDMIIRKATVNKIMVNGKSVHMDCVW